MFRRSPCQARVRGVGHARVLAGERADLAHDRLRPLERRAVRQGNVDEEVALILLRDEPGRQPRIEEAGAHEDGRQRDKGEDE